MRGDDDGCKACTYLNGKAVSVEPHLPRPKVCWGDHAVYTERLTAQHLAARGWMALT